MDKKQLKRVVKMTRKIWSLLTKDEKLTYFFDCGTISFINHVLDILYVKHELTEDELRYILSKVVFTK